MTPGLPERLEAILDRVADTPQLARPSVAEIRRLCDLVRLRPELLDASHTVALASAVAAILARDRDEHARITHLVTTFDEPQPQLPEVDRPSPEPPPPPGAEAGGSRRNPSARPVWLAVLLALVAAGAVAAFIIDPFGGTAGTQPSEDAPGHSQTLTSTVPLPPEGSTEPSVIHFRRQFPVSLPGPVDSITMAAPAPGPSYDAGLLLLLLGGCIGGVGFARHTLGVRRRRRSADVEQARRTLEPDRARPVLRSAYTLVGRQTLLAVADMLGRIHRPARGADLDGDATAEATAERAGRFMPRFEADRQPSDLTVLVDLEDGDHVWLGRLLRLMHDLQRQGVRLDIYAYHHTIDGQRAWIDRIDADGHLRTAVMRWSALQRRIRPLPPAARPALMLLARRPPERVDGHAPRWVDDLRVWRTRAWLDPDPRPLAERPHDEVQRSLEDFAALERVARRFPLDDRGLKSAAAWLSSDGQRPIADPRVGWEPPAPEHMQRWLALALLVPDARWDEIERLRVAVDAIGAVFRRPADVQHLLDHVEALAAGELGPDFTHGETRIEQRQGYGALHGLDLPGPARTRLIMDLVERDGGVDLIRAAARVLRDDAARTLAALRKSGEGTNREKVLRAKHARHHLLIEIDVEHLDELEELLADPAAQPDALEVLNLLQRWKAANAAAYAGDTWRARWRVERRWKDVVEQKPRLAKQPALMARIALGVIALAAAVHLIIGWATTPRMTLLRPADRAVNPEAAPPPEAPAVPDDMVGLPAGVFTMGSPPDEPDRDDDEHQHRVTLTRDFMIGRTQVTNAQWTALMGARPDPGGRFDEPDRPVEWVNWYEALAFLNARSAAEDLDPCYRLDDCGGVLGGGECDFSEVDGLYTCTNDDAYRCATAEPIDGCAGYRLPTEAEWEYAARAGRAGAFGAGDRASLPKRTWFSENSDRRTHAVAGLEANPWGLHDMPGNVLEWTADHMSASMRPLADETDPEGEAGPARVVRGCSWNNSARNCRVAHRVRFAPAYRYAYQGFRPARSFPRPLIPRALGPYSIDESRSPGADADAQASEAAQRKAASAGAEAGGTDPEPDGSPP